MTKKQRADLSVAALEKEYADAITTLDYTKPYELLFATRLAAQCTDERVNIVTKELFVKYPTLESFTEADVKEVEDIVRPCGLGPTKARDLVAAAKMIVADFGGQVPDTMEELTKIPGIGRKTAGVVLGDIFGKPAVVVDTHCIRITNLLGLSTSKNPLTVETQLWKVLEPDKASDFCHRLVLHGRAVCVARRPQCDKCVLFDYCKNSPAKPENQKKEKNPKKK